MKKYIGCAFVLIISIGTSAQSLITPFEKSGEKETATYFEAVHYYQTLAAKYRTIKILQFDTTDAGYPLHLVLFSTDELFNPAKWFEQGKIVLLINNGIHAGEPDGVDASMMLLRDLASGKIVAPSNVAIAIIPLYNIGGALNRGSFSRVNQEGPISYGFRGNAQNLNLNRDFTKLDAKNSRAFTKIFHYLNPDILVDNHVSDGADYQYTMTLLTTQHNKLGGAIGTFLHNNFEPALFKSMEQKHWGMTPYVDFGGSTPDQGWAAFYDNPMFSSGYAALFQTIGFTPETHMLKPFGDRVRSTYALMQSIIEEASKNAVRLKLSRKEALKEVIEQKQFPLSWKVDTTQFETLHFKGYEAASKLSDVTGMPRLYYDHSKPFEKDVKFFNKYVGDKIVTAPVAYIIPHGWWAVIDNLKLNGVKMQQLKKDTTINVEAYRIESFKSRPSTFESHHQNSEVVVSKKMQVVKFLKGDYVIYCNQPANRYIVEMLEPTGDDSFFAWNFFDAITEQKEYKSDYRWEDVAAAYVSTHPELKQQLEEKKKADSKFAASASAQLNFVYRNSPYYEPEHMRYPVYRLITNPLKN